MKVKYKRCTWNPPKVFCKKYCETLHHGPWYSEHQQSNWASDLHSRIPWRLEENNRFWRISNFEENYDHWTSFKGGWNVIISCNFCMYIVFFFLILFIFTVIEGLFVWKICILKGSKSRIFENDYNTFLFEHFSIKVFVFF